MTKRIITAIIIILIVAPSVYFGAVPFIILSTAFGFLAGYEICRLADEGWPKWAIWLIVAFFGASALLTNFTDAYSMALCGGLLMALLTLLVWKEEVHFDEVGIIFIVYFFMISVIRAFITFHERNVWIVFMILFATYFTDTFALFGGMAFGKHKLNERISPNKTIEGSLSGWVCGAAISLTFGLIVLNDVSRPFIIACALILPLLGQMGDLAFSAIKRYFKVKDFGNIFPGHGGVLDRIDSLLFTMTAAGILASLL